MCCDPFPPLSDLDITAGHVENVAHQIQRAAGPGSSSTLQWHDYLLQFGSCRAYLWDYFAVLLCWFIAHQTMLVTGMISVLQWLTVSLPWTSTLIFNLLGL